jgi:nucleoside diphosphate kinase
VDIVVEGNVELVKEILSRFSDRGLRIFLLRVREIFEKRE